MKKNIFEKEFRALGTDIYIGIVASIDEKENILKAFKIAEDVYKEQELIFSRFNPDSELSKINNNLGKFFNASDDLGYLVQKSIEYYDKSDGLFDPRILNELEKIGYRENFKDNKFESENFTANKDIFSRDLKEDLIFDNGRIKFLEKMDFAGVAKGYITDKVASALVKNGWEDFLVDSGGDMYASGLNKRNEKWGIALEGSNNEDEIVVEISNEGIATSGNTRKNWEIDEKKFHHLINPKDVNLFSFKLKSVSVISKTTQDADVWAKILFLMGLENGLEFANKNSIKSIFLKNNKDIIKSKELD